MAGKPGPISAHHGSELAQKCVYNSSCICLLLRTGYREGQGDQVSMMQCVCVLLLLVGITLADPTVFFMEKFETGEEQVVHEPLHDRTGMFQEL